MEIADRRGRIFGRLQLHLGMGSWQLLLQHCADNAHPMLNFFNMKLALLAEGNGLGRSRIVFGYLNAPLSMLLISQTLFW